MIPSIPRPALMIGLAGVLPFIYAAIAATEPRLELDFAPGYFVAENYGLVIFAYMSGVFWGFAAPKKAATKDGWRWMGLAVAPAVIGFLALVALPPGETLTILLWAFPLLLPLDWMFQREKLAPKWWLTLRILLTVLVTGCLWLAASGAGEAL